MNEIQGSIIDAIKTLVNNAVDNIQADTTIIATISKEVSMDNKMYYAEYNGGTIPVYANEFIYHVGDVVYVLVPQGNMSNRKVIVSLVDGSEGTNANKKASGLGDYTQGENGIVDRTYTSEDDSLPSKKVFPIELYSKRVEDYRLLYASESVAADFGLDGNSGSYDNPMLNIAGNFARNMNSSQAIMLAANIQSDFSSDLAGDFGIILDYKYTKSNSPDILNKTITLNSTKLRGNPKKLNQKYLQYVLEEFEGTFLEINYIAAYCKNYVSETDETAAADIKISNISLYPMEANVSEINGYKLSVTATNGGKFTSNNAAETLKLIASVSKDGSDITSQCEFMWAKGPAPDIKANSKNYNINFGEGYYYLGDEYKSSTITINAADNMSKENIYYCIAKCNNELAGRWKGTKIVNTAAQCIGKLFINDKYYDNGETYEFDLIYDFDREMTIECGIFNEELDVPVDTNGGNYVYYWSMTDYQGNTYTLDKTAAEVEQEYTEEMESLEKTGKTTDGLLTKQEYLIKHSMETTIAEFVKNDGNLIDNQLIFDVANGVEGNATISCLVKYNNANFANCSIRLVSKTDIFSQSRVEIENGNQSFQYSVAGISPAHESMPSPQEIQPLVAKLYDTKNLTIGEDSVSSYSWILPTSNTLLVVNESSSNNTLSFGIKDNYDHYADNNQIKLAVTLKDGSVINGTTNLFFSKVGADGSNGSENTVKIVENSVNLTNSDGERVRLALYREQDEWKWNNDALADNLTPINNVKNIFSGLTYTNGIRFTNLANKDIEWTYPRSCFENGEPKTHYTYNGENFGINDSNENGNEIITYHVKDDSQLVDNLDHFANYPIPSIEYKDGCKYNQYKLSIAENQAIKYIEYSASGKSPVYYNKSGVTLLFDWDYTSIEWETSFGVNISKTAGGFGEKKFELQKTSIEDSESVYKKYIKDIAARESKELTSESETLLGYLATASSYENALKSIEKYLSEKYSDAAIQNTSMANLLKNINEIFTPVKESLYNYYHSIDAKKVYISPYSTIPSSGNYYIKATIKNGATTIAIVKVPIHIYMNYYENADVINWDGTSAIMEGKNVKGASGIFGTKSDNTDNKFTGVILGSIEDGENKNVGLMAYAQGESTAFLDANTGKFELGKNKEIVLNPSENKPSKIGGWCIGENSLFRILDESNGENKLLVKEPERHTIEDSYSGILLDAFGNSDKTSNGGKAHIEVQKAVKNYYNFDNPYTSNSGNLNDYIELDITANQEEDYILRVQSKTAKPKTTVDFCFGTGPTGGIGYVTYNSFLPWTKGTSYGAYIYKESTTLSTSTKKTLERNDIDLTVVDENTPNTWTSLVGEIGQEATSVVFIPGDNSINVSDVNIKAENLTGGEGIYHFGELITGVNLNTSFIFSNSKSNFNTTEKEYTSKIILKTNVGGSNEISKVAAFTSTKTWEKVLTEDLEYKVSTDGGLLTIDNISDNTDDKYWYLYVINDNNTKGEKTKLFDRINSSCNIEAKKCYVISYETDNDDTRVSATDYGSSDEYETNKNKKANSLNCIIRGLYYYDVKDLFYEKNGQCYKLEQSNIYSISTWNSQQSNGNYTIKNEIPKDDNALEKEQTVARLFSNNNVIYPYLYTCKIDKNKKIEQWYEANDVTLGFFIDQYGNIGGRDTTTASDTQKRYVFKSTDVKTAPAQESEASNGFYIANSSKESAEVYKYFNTYMSTNSEINTTYITPWSSGNKHTVSLGLLYGVGGDLRIAANGGSCLLRSEKDSITIRNIGNKEDNYMLITPSGNGKGITINNLPLTTNKKITVSDNGGASITGLLEAKSGATITNGATITGATTIRDSTDDDYHFKLGNPASKDGKTKQSNNKIKGATTITDALYVSNSAGITVSLTASNGLKIDNNNTWKTSGEITASSTVSGTDFLFLAD